jgi:hypothetical protein
VKATRETRHLNPWDVANIIDDLLLVDGDNDVLFLEQIDLQSPLPNALIPFF